MTMFHNDNVLHLEALCPEQNYLKQTRPIAMATGLILAHNRDASLCRFCILHEDRRVPEALAEMGTKAVVQRRKAERQWTPIVKA